MVEMFDSLGIHSQIQRQAIELLAGTRRGYMRSDLLRLRLIKSLAGSGSGALYLAKINAEIEALVEEAIVLRQIKRGEHEVGLNKVLWTLSPETVKLISEATRSAVRSLLVIGDSPQLVREVKRQLRKMGGLGERVGESALRTLISRCCFQKS